MGAENNWKQRTLEELENEVWSDEMKEETYLIQTCAQLRKKRLVDFTTEDLRIMIGQRIGLLYLIPLALEVLHSNVLAAGDFYEGDLLVSVLRSDETYWQREKKQWQRVIALIEKNRNILSITHIAPVIEKR
ncbi:contact-dependent growth inhibition system immunity protein [Runella sp. MFBS21]|uniref:contact-dependent growth inhibition system immunity protein n=1 Tax=Runella sp. MFBS21 TaxID=3034018 RepID=UPI0023F752CA|nr:contact-dependent growth inhibition system immunity protein [Runella sp. MFBS21]MDF7820499.1 contact-dependent growth inhibition system immunity protein [Runella sp. MFBS21]